MFTNQEIVAIVFRLINFIALLGVGFFLFKKYILPNLLASITRKKEHQASLSLQQTTLEKQQLALDIFLKEDTLLCAEFRSKINKWKQAIIHTSELHEKEHNKILITSKNRAYIIASQREHNRIQKIVTHAVVTNLEESLSIHFKNKQQNSEYLNAIFNFMNEKAP